MRCLLLLLLLFAFPTFSNSQSQPNKKVTKIEHVFEWGVDPKARLTTKWVFVVDRSSSLWHKPDRGVLKGLRQAFKFATQYPEDELSFSIYKFHDKNKEKFRNWKHASVKEFKKAEKWIMEGHGIYSYGKEAINKALRQKVKELSVIIITDGGFTSASSGRGFGAVQQVIENAQAWRIEKGYGEAIICTIGIENKDYFGGGKPDDKVCQEYLKKIGSRYNGGYLYVRKKSAKRRR